ncbi:toll/interleukin-1 receptor domain-containing protein [Kocuria rhizosphaericola]|uniref:toll/interleukin-1 receptor domain-containing protein n=1 Tax=Kocuria rhizosphaericola TaxID=3376284 RepID=UPI0037A7C72E
MEPDNVTQTAPNAQRNLFLSYSRQDRDVLQSLVETITDVADHRLWVDRRLEGGQDWWEEILGQIRRCDALIVAVSPSLLDSVPSALERQYARRLGKTVIPVMVRPVSPHLLPSDLGPTQIIDYTAPQGPGQLVKVLLRLPTAPPPREPLPAPPPVPISYMAELADKARRPVLSFEEQMGLVSRLEAAMERPLERDAAITILRSLDQRTDIFVQPGRAISELLARSPFRPPTNRPSRRLVLSIAALVLTLIPLLGAPGLLALYFSWQVEQKWGKGDPPGSSKASRKALVSAAAGISFGLLFWSWALSSNDTPTTVPYYY